MTGNNLPSNQLLSTLLFFASLLSCSCSCKPVINSFKVTSHDTVEVRRMTAEDTLRVNWDVKGKPTLLIHETQLDDSTSKLLELKLVVEKAGKEANRIIQVQMLPSNSETTITFRTRFNTTEDTLIADGINDPEVYGDRFEIVSVSNASGRPLIVSHSNKTETLDASGVSSNLFAGTPVEGKWEFRSAITPEEKKDNSLLPERLRIKATINYKRR